MKKVKISVVAVLLLITLLITLLSGCYSVSSVMKRNPEAEKMGFSVISIEDWIKMDCDLGNISHENYEKGLANARSQQTKYGIQIERNEENTKYSHIYIKKIGKKDFYQESDIFGSGWLSKKGCLVLDYCKISKEKIIVHGNTLFEDMEFAFLTAEQNIYIDSLECDDVTKWEWIKEISDKVIQWNI